MTAAPLPLDELRALADAACEGNLSPSEAARLEALLRGSAAAQQFYLAYVRLDGCLRWEFGNRALGEREDEKQEGPGGGRREAGDAGQESESTEYGVRSAEQKSTATPLPIPRPVVRTPYSVLGTFPDPSSVTPHPSPFILHPFLSATMLSYVAAALILGLGVLAAWGWGIRGARGPAPEVAVTSPAAPPSREISPGGKMERPCLGKIVPLTKCTWRGSQTLDSCCEMGCIELVSGSLEVTYRTGTKVVIEGPALYIAESLNGGYLGVGKIKVVCPGATSGTRDWQPQPAADKSQHRAPEPSLFVLHTPNVNFTTPGAVFSVSGDISGECYATVDRGSVELTPLFDDFQRPILLHEGQSALSGLNVRGEQMVLVGKGEMPAIFARQMPKSLPAFSIDTIRGRARPPGKNGAFRIEGGSPRS